MAHEMPILDGGVGTKADIAPTIIFIVLFILLAGLSLWNLVLRGSRRACHFAQRPVMHGTIGRLPFLVLHLIQAFGEGRNTKAISIIKEGQIIIGHFTLIYAAIDCLVPLIQQAYGKKYLLTAQLLVAAFVWTLLGATVTGAIQSFFWWDGREGDFRRQRTVLALRLVSTVIPLVIVAVLFFGYLLFALERRHWLRTGNKRPFRWLTFGPTADYSKISKESLIFPFAILVPMLPLVLYRVIVAHFVLVPTPQDPSAYPLPMTLFYSTVRSRALFYTFQLAMECIAMLPFAFYDLRKIYDLDGKWGWKVSSPATNNADEK
ncbi:hypothetical protein BT69DRAFT_1336534 [Atractiella rhizophila]|nr:hypothetical protein BT69DRAFT_1336534 [Atractiella rhizophila]